MPDFAQSFKAVLGDTVEVDGKPFPWYITPDINVQSEVEDGLSVVTIELYVDGPVLIDSKGEEN